MFQVDLLGIEMMVLLDLLLFNKELAVVVVLVKLVNLGMVEMEFRLI